MKKIVETKLGKLELVIENLTIVNGHGVPQEIIAVIDYNKRKQQAAYELWRADKEIVFDHKIKNNYLTLRMLPKYK
jgi:hypothetical protein